MIKNIHFIHNKSDQALFECIYYSSAYILKKNIMTLKTNSVMSFLMVGIVLLVFPVKLALNQWIIYTCIIIWFAFAYYLDYDDDVQVMGPEDTDLVEFLKDRELKKKTERPLNEGEKKAVLPIKKAILDTPDHQKKMIIHQILCNPRLYETKNQGKSGWDRIYMKQEISSLMKEAYEVFHNIIRENHTNISNNMGPGYIQGWGYVPLIIPPLQRALLSEVSDEQKEKWNKFSDGITLHPLLPRVKITLRTDFFRGGYRGPYEPKAFESR